jgi:hypothetical protein
MTIKHAEIHLALPEVCDTILEAIGVLQGHWHTTEVSKAIAELDAALDRINDADVAIAAHNERVVANIDFGNEGNWDGACWRNARDGDQIRLRDPQARDNGGPVYVIDGVPAYRADGTLSVRAFLLPAPTQSWNWPEGNSQLEFSEDCWQVWRDYSA